MLDYQKLCDSIDVSQTEFKILHLLTRFKFTDIIDVSTTANASIKHTKALIKNLKDKGLVDKTRISGKKTALCLTTKGYRLLGIKNNEGSNTLFANHSMTCTKIAMKLIERGFTSSNITIEQRVRSQQDQKLSILPDLLINLSDESKICIEVELIQKEESRLREKLDRYSKFNNILRVIYLCANGATRYLVTNTAHTPQVIALPIEPLDKAIQATINIIKNLNNKEGRHA